MMLVPAAAALPRRPVEVRSSTFWRDSALQLKICRGSKNSGCHFRNSRTGRRDGTCHDATVSRVPADLNLTACWGKGRSPIRTYTITEQGLRDRLVKVSVPVAVSILSGVAPKVTTGVSVNCAAPLFRSTAKLKCSTCADTRPPELATRGATTRTRRQRLPSSSESHRSFPLSSR